MSIRTATAMVSTGDSAKSGRAFNDLIFRPGDHGQSIVVTVDQLPIHIFGALPRDYTMNVLRVYNGPSRECNDIPDLPVACASGVLVNDGTDMVTDQWITHRGSYSFELMDAGGALVTEVPDDVYVWFMYDDSIEGCCNGC